MSPTGLVALYEQFKSLTDALIDRFQIPTPLSLPYSLTCPPAHEDSHSFLIIPLQNHWAEYCLELIDSSAQGDQPTITGRALSPIFPGSSEEDTRRQVRGIARTVADSMNFQYPVWHNCGFTVNVARQLGLQNRDEIDLGLSGNFTAGYATRLRNYVVHPGPTSRRDFLRVAAHYGMPDADPVTLLRSPQLGGSTLFEIWVRELQGAARKSAE